MLEASNEFRLDDAWIIETPPRFVLPLAGPFGALLLGIIAVLSLS